MKVFETITEVIGWVQIVASPLLAGLAIGGVVYLEMGGTAGLIIGIAIALAGLATGVVWATRVWRKQGTRHYMSRLSGTPELDKKETG
jgi:hypothetical protein